MASEAPVLIAGGGLTGLAAAAFLAQQGIRSIAIERLKESSPLPRAAFFHMRTMEMFRGLGIEDRVREESAKEFVPDGALVAMDCVSGRKLADIISNLNEGVDAVSPCRRWFLNQPSLEPILRERARAAGATVIQGAEVTALRQHERGVTVTVRDVDGGNERELAGEYLIAADGGHSKVRELLGIGYEGRGAFSKSLTIYFSADLSPWIGTNAWSIIYVNNPVLAGFFRMNRASRVGFLGVNAVGDPTRDPEAASNASADLSERRMIELVRAGVGQPDLAVQLNGYSRWRATADVAQRFSDKRIFIIGDAAHLMPPNGGFGGNTGIHDAHNLAWKLALVTKGSAAPQLLETYDLERRPIAEATLAQALARLAAWFKNLGERLPRTPPLLEDRTVIFGTCYGEGAFLAEESSLGELFEDPRAPSGCPGSRSPHVEIEVGTRRVALHDLTGNGFLLLVGADGMAWCEPSAILAAELGLDLQCVQVQDQSAQSRLAEAFGIKEQGAVVIRPDGIIGWRCRTGAADPAGLLHKGLQRMLGHSLPK